MKIYFMKIYFYEDLFYEDLFLWRFIFMNSVKRAES